MLHLIYTLVLFLSFLLNVDTDGLIMWRKSRVCCWSLYLQNRGGAVTHRLANGSTTFIWKLYCHWSKSLWLAISLQQSISVYFVIWKLNYWFQSDVKFKIWRLWAINIIDQLLQTPIIKLSLTNTFWIQGNNSKWKQLGFRIALANIVWQCQHQ